MTQKSHRFDLYQF